MAAACFSIPGSGGGKAVGSQGFGFLVLPERRAVFRPKTVCVRDQPKACRSLELQALLRDKVSVAWPVMLTGPARHAVGQQDTAKA